MLVLFSLLSGTSFLSSQEYRFKTLGVENGLSQITVSDICQDEKSRIWIATLDGVNCFDGNTIRVFNHFHNDSISYGNLHATQMVADGCGSLFLLTATGVFRLDLDTEQYERLPVASPVALAAGKHGVWIADATALYLYRKESQTHRQTVDSVLQPLYADLLQAENGTSIVEDSLGTIWLSLKEGGMTRIDRHGTLSTHLPGIKIMKLMTAPDTTLWVGSQTHGIYHLSPQGKLIRHYAPGSNHLHTVRNDMARALCQDREGNIWVGYRSGLSKIEPSTGHIFHYDAAPNRTGGLSNRSVTSLYTDRQGTVWVGTYWGGINYFSPEEQRFTHYYAAADGLSFPVVGVMTEDRDGQIWICTEGGGLNLYQPRCDTFRHFNAQTDCRFSSDFLKDIVYDRTGHCLWIAADYTNRINCFSLDSYQNRIYSLTDRHGNAYSEDSIGEALFALADTSDKLYIGATSAVICLDKRRMTSEVLFHQANLFTHNYNTLLLDRQGRLWFATNEGCAAYHTDTHHPDMPAFNIYKMVLEQEVSSQKELVNAIYEDSAGKIWVGTHGSGLFKLDEASGTFRLHTAAGALSGSNIRVLGETPSGNLLIGTGHGLSMLNKGTEQITNFNTQTGFPLTLVNRKSLYVSRHQDIYIGGATGLIVIRESTLHDPPKAYDLQLTDLYIHDRKIEPRDSTGILTRTLAYTDHIRLTHEQDRFAIGFTTDNYLHLGGDEAEYRLDGYANRWTDIRPNNHITYNNLDPGEYLLEIRLKNYPDITRRLHITLERQPNHIWWAYLLYAVIFPVVGATMYLYRIRRSRQMPAVAVEYPKEEEEKREEKENKAEKEKEKDAEKEKDEVYTFVDAATPAHDREFIRRAICIVEENMEGEAFSVEDLAREMGVGRTVLFQKIKNITGITPNNLIMTLRLKKAAWLLLHAPELNVSDIAYQLSFGNPNYFNRCFREAFGMSATEYRKNK
ncbi:MAG: helix-turn-helix domain-containing protein [Prevotellaceae bacterium]|jgi:ligand-binding sensor domain-containing protein/AraC-like DNA-binding protein|nr:helix-turn-helix domain-containing protein [Prevotellaceae bacterium]